MALPPQMTAGPTDAAAAQPAMETSGMEGGDMPMEADTGWMPVATILRNDAGEFMLVEGDEPDDGSEPQGEVFASGPNVLRALMDKLEGTAEADKAFDEGFKGAAKKPPMPSPMAG